MRKIKKHPSQLEIKRYLEALDYIKAPPTTPLSESKPISQQKKTD